MVKTAFSNAFPGIYKKEIEESIVDINYNDTETKCFTTESKSFFSTINPKFKYMHERFQNN